MVLPMTMNEMYLFVSPATLTPSFTWRQKLACKRIGSHTSICIQLHSRAPTRCAASQNGGERLRIPERARRFALCGVGALSLALVNRLALTTELSPFQSRADIVAVVCGVSLLVYGAASVDVAERAAPVAQRGVDLPFETTLASAAAGEARFVLRAALSSIDNFVSAAIFIDGKAAAREGIFRGNGALDELRCGDVVRRATVDAKVAYLADLRVVPTKEIEFPFLPRECQAVVIVPIGNRGAVVFGSDKVRPMQGADFGWLTAVCDRLDATI